MTIPIDIPFNFGVGAAIAISAGRQMRTDATPHARHMVLRQAAWWGAWFGVNVSYQYFAWPDWMWAYLVDPQKVHAAVVVPLFTLANVVVTMIGAACASPILARGHVKPALAVMVAGFVGWLCTIFVTFQEYTHVGTAAEFAAGTARKIQQHEELQEASMWTILLLAVPGLLLLATNAVRGGRIPVAEAPPRQ